MKPRTEIPEVIAEVITVAIAIATSIAVAGWLMGLCGQSRTAPAGSHVAGRG